MKTLLFFILLSVSLIPFPVHSKNRYFDIPPNFSKHAPSRVSALEERFRPYLENRLRARLNPTIRSIPDKQSEIPYNLEIMMLARAWSSLSEDFRRLYVSSLLFPDNFEVYISPGGHFEVYYTTKGIDAVSAVDQYHYSSISPFYRINQPNNIPDYIDETAWALDSAWRMEVDRFGFKPPYPYMDSLRSSERYKVLIQYPGENEDDMYGYTMFHRRIDNNSFSSFIVMRNEWSGFNSEPLKYDSDPTPAIRVTCAHEFFHAIQYAMTWDVVDSSLLDDFPLTWTEGCAAAMEELAFPDVNDYVQYTKSYFSKPDISFFSQRIIDYKKIYLQSLFIIYMTTRLSNETSAGFVREMYTNNYETIMPFRENIDKSLAKTVMTWPQTLNKFHTASYFTGSRSDTMLFIADADKFSEWNPESHSTQSITENSVGIFSINHQNIHYDTLFIRFQPGEEIPEQNSWAGSIILRQDKTSKIIPVELNKEGRGGLNVPNWNAHDECIAVISSGFSESLRKYTVEFSPCMTMHISGSTDTITGSSGKTLQPYAIVHATSNLRCDLTITPASNTRMMSSVALQNNIQLMDSLFYVDFPITWKDSAHITLCIDSIPKGLVLFRWHQDSQSWIQQTNTSTDANDIRTAISDIGTYGCFTTVKSADTKAIIAYPNPAHIHRGNAVITLEGYDIKAVAIYSVSGTLIHQASKNDLQGNTIPGTPERFYWTLRNKQGVPLSPGVYTILTQYSNNKKTKTTKTKILLIP